MPRSARSASRPLTPNRSDLTRPTSTTVPGQGYGEAAQQRAAQQAIPMGSPPIAGGSSPAAPSAPAQQPQLQDVLAAAQAHNGPGNLPLTRPTERPNEPVTHGLPVGPGAGPEALGGVGAAARENVVEQGTLRNLLTNIAAAPGATSAIRDLAARAQGGVM